MKKDKKDWNTEGVKQKNKNCFEEKKKQNKENLAKSAWKSAKYWGGKNLKQQAF